MGRRRMVADNRRMEQAELEEGLKSRLVPLAEQVAASLLNWR